MKLTIFSTAPILIRNGEHYLYSPYLKEIKLWAKHCNHIEFCCPIWRDNYTLLVEKLDLNQFNYTIKELDDFNISSINNTFKTIIMFPKLFFKIYNVMKNSEHIHLRCPGNVGLLACIVQILFPNKPKTAKYAGNWDPKSSQPWSYRLQKWILRNTFLTKNMQVLVYGEWENQSKNIKSFFTATYTEEEYKGQHIVLRDYMGSTLRLLFVGTLSEGKRPLYALRLVEELHKQGLSVQLEICGEGIEREKLERYIHSNKLDNVVFLRGNLSKEEIKRKYQRSHFLILPSKSEGWPKVVAEAMFWGCIPISTPISCVPYMLDKGKRGILLDLDLEKDTQQLIELIDDKERYMRMNEAAMSWSRVYTMEKFENEIVKLLQ